MSEKPKLKIDTRAQQVAQEKLVDQSLRIAIDMLYEKLGDKVNPIRDGVSLGKDKEEVLATLRALPTEFARFGAFNGLAKRNKYDLSLKSSGKKELDSAERKMAVRGKVKDLVRITVISGDVDVLDEFVQRQQKAIEAEEKVKVEPEPWHVRPNAQLEKVTQSTINGFGAEVQYLPREQAQVANRISHRYYKVLRKYDTIKKLEHDDPEYAGWISSYNRLADFINILTSQKLSKISKPLLIDANDALLTSDRSSVTFDESGPEGGETSPSAFSAIFETRTDLRDYRNYLRSMGIDGAMPKLVAAESTAEEVAFAKKQLDNVNQITHAVYMREANPAMRDLWTREALRTNSLAKDESLKVDNKLISLIALDAVEKYTMDEHRGRS